ncbi:MAG: hypothetical protein M3010_10295 [Candidatus Dormibacteraeota bacterium]|nr:hypothetical protein [Candidatus Dormibacteraeota bacterium]
MPGEPEPAPVPPPEAEPVVADFGAIAFVLGLLVLAILLMLTMVHH